MAQFHKQHLVCIAKYFLNFSFKRQYRYNYMWPNVPKWVLSLNKWLCILLEFWIEHIKTKKVIYYMVQYSKYSQRYDTLNKKIAKTQFGEKQL